MIRFIHVKVFTVVRILVQCDKAKFEGRQSYGFGCCRMTKETFIKLCDAIRPNYKQKLPRGDSPLISVTLSLMITLYYLSRQLSMQDIGAHFNVSASVVCNESKQIVGILCDLASQYIKWPSVDEIHIVSQQFSERANFPGKL